MLRAEWMDEDYWWWSVYDMENREITIEDSNEYTEKFIGGNAARKKAGSVAINYINTITSKVMAKFTIKDIFKITGRGIVFAGNKEEGVVSIGDTIEFTAFDSQRHRRIIGIEGNSKSQPDKVNIGLLIKCNSDAEIDELKNWKPNKSVAIIFNTSGK